MRTSKFTCRFKSISLMLFVVLHVSCSNEPQPEVCTEFFEKDSTPRLKEFQNYDLTKQLAIHRCGLDRRPRSDHSFEIANRGRSLVPTLLEQLNRKDFSNTYDAELSKFGIILIFQRLGANGELAESPTALRSVEKAVSEIKTDWIHTEADKSLSDIRRKIITQGN